MIKLFYYNDGRVRVITETQYIIFTPEEWARIGRSFEPLFP